MRTSPNRFWFAIGLLVLAAFATSVHAGQAGAIERLAMKIETKEETGAGAPSIDTPTGSLPAPKEELLAGGVKAKLKLTGAGIRLPAGTPAFAEIVITNVGGAKHATAELVLDPDVAEIRHVSGKLVTLQDTGDSRIAVVKKLRKGKARKLSVELLLRGDQGAASEDVVNRLRITLRPGDGAASDSTIVSWPVADCASRFYRQIVAVREQNADRIGKALKAAWARDRERRGRWLFAPSVSRRAKRVCRRWTRVWDWQRGRYRSRCTRYVTVRRASPSGIKPTKAERAVIRLADKYVRSRARDPRLSSKQHYGWVSQKAASDVRRYLRQDKHPAICTGVEGFVGYYEERMADVTKKAKEFEEELAKARKLVEARIKSIRDIIKAEPGGHPGWGTAPLSLADDGDDRTLTELIAELVGLADDRASVADVTQAPSAYEALKRAKAVTSDEGFKQLSKDTRKLILHTLTLLEAAEYIAAVGRHYSELDQSITGSLRALRAAHGEHCTCGN